MRVPRPESHCAAYVVIDPKEHLERIHHDGHSTVSASVNTVQVHSSPRWGRSDRNLLKQLDLETEYQSQGRVKTASGQNDQVAIRRLVLDYLLSFWQ